MGVYVNITDWSIEPKGNATIEEIAEILGQAFEVDAYRGEISFNSDHKVLENEKGVANEAAPYIEDGSYIEICHNEGGGSGLCRYVFKDGECKTVSPEIKW